MSWLTNKLKRISTDMDVQLDIQVAVEEGESEIPSRQLIQHWVQLALENCRQSAHLHAAEMTIRIVGEQEISDLNQQYRNKQGPTNVLSFPFDADVELDIPLLGDLVICAAIVASEAKEQHKSLQAHWAHMIIHGTLHLLGYDHLTDSEAELMENEEINLLQQLGFSNPYEAITHS